MKVDMTNPEFRVGHGAGVVSVRITAPAFGEGIVAVMTPENARIAARAILVAAANAEGRRPSVLRRLIGGRRG